MKNAYLVTLLLTSALATGCTFENTAKLLSPTAPSGNVGDTAGTMTSTGGGNASGGSSTTATPASAFSGAWSSSSIAGLPIGNCADLKWLIAEQSATSIGGTVSATCSGGATVSAILNGQLNGTDKVNLTGLGTRQADASMKLDYQGRHCLGNISGSETLRRFPVVP